MECSYHARTPAEQRGAELYARMCAVCHGADGEGYKADNAPALGHPDFLASVSDAYLHDAVAGGRAGTTMSAWGTERGGPLPRADVDAVVAFLRTWATGDPARLDERPPSGNSFRGALAFGRHCASCHGSRGVTGTAIHIGDAALLASASNGFLRYAIAHGRRGTPMAAFADTLGEGGIEDTVALLRSWQAQPAPAARAAPAMWSRA